MRRAFFIIFVFGFMVSLSGLDAPTAAAQDDCENLKVWLVEAQLVMDEYEDALIVPNIDAVATLQRLRRGLEAASRPSYADAAYTAWIKTLNLTEEAMVAALVSNDPSLVGEGINSDLLWEQADLQHDVAVGETINLIDFVSSGCPDTTPPTPSAEAATISEPPDGADVTWQTDVSGTYNPDLLGEDDLWIFLVTPGKLYFPQIIEGCDPDKRLPLALEPDFEEWSIQIFVGEENANQGEEFRIVLMKGDAAASQKMYELFDGWCATMSFEGLTSQEVRDLGFEGIVYIEVTRQ
jgi:hypothetical protein